MTHPDRLSEKGDAFERSLLLAGKAERPRSGATERSLEALGLGMAAGASVGLGLTKATSVVAGRGLRAAGAHLLTPFIKVVLISASIVVAGGAVTLGVRSRSSTRTALALPAPPPTASAEVAAPAPVAAAEQALPALEADATDPDPPATSSRRERPRAGPRRPPARPTPARPNDVTIEVGLLDRARVSLASHDPSETLQTLAQYEATPPPHLLAAEGTVLKIESLLMLGRRPEAEKLAAGFLRDNPNSPHARRVRSLLNGGPLENP